jgi:O-antigen/teichoic acid export membrane protein
VRAALESPPGRGRLPRLRYLGTSRLVRQNLVLFLGGFTAGLGGFVYHAVAGRWLGTRTYGEVSALVALYTVGTAVNLTLVLVLARCAAHLQAMGRLGAIRPLMRRTGRAIALPALLLCLAVGAIALPAADFLRLSSAAPLVWLGLAVALYWFTAIPRGILQGLQRFPALAANLSLELVVRTLTLVALLALGLSVTGSMMALVAGVGFAYLLGTATLRDLRRHRPEPDRMGSLAGFGMMAAAGTVGVLWLYNVDVVLAKHYLGAHQAGIYGGLNKIETILYYATVSVSQVLFPRVVEAISTRRHPGRLLLLSCALIVALGLGAIVIFGAVPGLVVQVLYGPAFADAGPFVLPVGVIGLGLSLDNLLVQFLIAVRDQWFIPVMSVGCAFMVALIAVFHSGLGQIVADVFVCIFGLLGALGARSLVILSRLRAEAGTQARL